jgi:hypothetical protein
MKNAAPRRKFERILSGLILLRELPGYLPFAPLAGRSLFGQSRGPAALGGVPGDLTAAEREWLTAQVRRTPLDGVIAQSEGGPPAADATCALALGCWASRRRLYVLWPAGAARGAEFRKWHRTIIRQGLAPYVTPATGGESIPSDVDLLVMGEGADWSKVAGPATTVIVRGPAGPDGMEMERADACGTLSAIRLKAPPESSRVSR